MVDTLAGRSHEDFILLTTTFFDTLLSHVRFDALSSLQLTLELGKICNFEEGECTLAWVGAFQSFPVQLFGTPTARWKVLDSRRGVVKEGVYDVSLLEDVAYRKPSDCTVVLDKVMTGGTYKPCP